MKEKFIERLQPNTLEWKKYHSQSLILYKLVINLCRGKRVLDAACGSGYFSNFILNNGAKCVTGIDKDSNSILYAKTHFPSKRLKFINLELEKLNLLKEKFDVIVSIETIEHLIDQKKVLKNFAQILGDGGRLIISTPNKKMSAGENPYHLQELNLSEFKNLVSDNFKIINIFGSIIDKEKELRKLSKIHQIIAKLSPNIIRKLIPLKMKLTISHVLNKNKDIKYELSDINITDDPSLFKKCYGWLIIAKRRDEYNHPLLKY